ncbi:transcription regulator protein BACH1-like [Aplochiton taeniatus]
MPLLAPHTSVFTFQSAVHSSHVLQCLNEQRLRDVLCDVTVVVEDRNFRAHCSVLVSCSSYFHSRITNNRPGLVITLPDEVTVEGFEPLLQFAYTSKLLFTKESIQSIHRCAAMLGFHNLEMSCFDFLLPKFSDSVKIAPQASPKSCCCNMARRVKEQAATTESQKSGSNSVECANDGNVDSPTEPCGSGPSDGNVQTDFPQKQTVGAGEPLCLQSCGPQMSPLSLGLSTIEQCPVMASSDPAISKANPDSPFCEGAMLQIRECAQSEGVCALACELPCSEDDDDDDDDYGVGDLGQTVGALLAGNDGDKRPSCPLAMSGADTELLESKPPGLEVNMAVDLSESALSALSQEPGFEERRRVEREVAEHLATGFWPDMAEPHPLDSMDQSGLGKAGDFHWLKQLDLSSNTGDCPFLRDLGASEPQGLGADSLCQSEQSPCMSSGNSGEDSDLDTDGDMEANNRRAQEVRLPFPVEQISALSRSAFQQLLRRQKLTPEQLEFVHDVRRRSKNRAAAQRCRKRKLDSIHKLECDINVLRNQKERLLQERSELELSMKETRQGLFGLCQNVSSQARPETHPLQAQPSSPECPFVALLTPKTSPSAPGQDEDPAAVETDLGPTEDHPAADTPETIQLCVSLETEPFN